MDANAAALATAQKRINGSVEKMYGKVRRERGRGLVPTGRESNSPRVVVLVVVVVVVGS